MSIEAIAAVGTQLAATVAPAAPTAVDAARLTPATDGVFDRLVDSLAQIDTGMKNNASAATDLALGQADNLHQVMIGAERTRLQFELAMSVRNRVLEAYQEIMRMQV